MVMFSAYPPDRAPHFRLLQGPDDSADSRRAPPDPASGLGVVDGLVSITRKAWFSRTGSDDNDDNRATQ